MCTAVCQILFGMGHQIHKLQNIGNHKEPMTQQAQVGGYILISAHLSLWSAAVVQLVSQGNITSIFCLLSWQKYVET